MTLSVVFAFLIQSAPAMVGEIGERLAKPASFILDSSKTPDRLELCIADVISNDLTAAAFRDGPDRTVVVGSLNIQFHS